MTSNRLPDRLEMISTAGQKALGIFVTAGFPTLEATNEILQCLDKSDVDFIELGMPFSDPLAEGPTIQETSAVALANGVDLDFILAASAEFRSYSDKPLVLMGYINPIFKYGVSNFCAQAASSGVDGLIIADLPYHESAFLRQHASKQGLDVIHLVTPNTSNDRIVEIDLATTGFVYAVSLIGLTGANIDKSGILTEYLQRLQKLVVNNKVLAGFGIRSVEDSNAMASLTDGVIVGSAFLSRIASKWDDLDSPLDKQRAVQNFVTSVKPTIGT